MSTPACFLPFQPSSPWGPEECHWEGGWDSALETPLVGFGLTYQPHSLQVSGTPFSLAGGLQAPSPPHRSKIITHSQPRAWEATPSLQSWQPQPHTGWMLALVAGRAGDTGQPSCSFISVSLSASAQEGGECGRVPRQWGLLSMVLKPNLELQSHFSPASSGLFAQSCPLKGPGLGGEGQMLPPPAGEGRPALASSSLDLVCIRRGGLLRFTDPQSLFRCPFLGPWEGLHRPVPSSGPAPTLYLPSTDSPLHRRAGGGHAYPGSDQLFAHPQPSL